MADEPVVKQRDETERRKKIKIDSWFSLTRLNFWLNQKFLYGLLHCIQV